MPVYEYRCPEGHTFEVLLPVAEYRKAQVCRCGLGAEKVILHAPRVFGDFPGYESPASGRWIEGRRARADDLARTGCRPYEAGETQDLARRQAENERQLDKVTDEVVERTLAEITV